MSHLIFCRYHWYKDVPTPQHEILWRDWKKWEGKLEISEDGKRLKFLRPGRHLSAIYYCAGSNSLGTGMPEPAYLNVTYPPDQIEITPQDGRGNTNAWEGERYLFMSSVRVPLSAGKLILHFFGLPLLDLFVIFYRYYHFRLQTGHRILCVTYKFSRHKFIFKSLAKYQNFFCP